MPYIFGYGSLIEQSSRTRTTPAAICVLPAWVSGSARGWWARTGAIGITMTFVGAIVEKSSSVNGVVYAVSQQELEATDCQEQGYIITDITKCVNYLYGQTPKDEVGIFVNDFKNEEELWQGPARRLTKHRVAVLLMVTPIRTAGKSAGTRLLDRSGRPFWHGRASPPAWRCSGPQ
jgi:cation transport regulator ChaC